MRRVLQYPHFFLLSLLIIVVGYRVASPYIPSAIRERSKPCFFVIKDEGKSAVVVKARVNPAAADTSFVNLLSCAYQASLSALSPFEKKKVQRAFEQRSLFHTGCSFELFKKELFRNNIFFWNQVETVMVGIPKQKPTASRRSMTFESLARSEYVDWIPLSDFTRYPQIAEFGFERYMFLYPGLMTFMKDVPSALQFFNDYFLGREPFIVTKKIPAAAVYLKIIVADRTESSVFQDCSFCK